MNNSQPSFDALLPREMAQRAESIGASKADMQAMTMFSLAVLAGAFIALGAVFATTVTSGAGAVSLGGTSGTAGSPFGLSKLLAGLVFCLGLILVVVAGAELFTGNNLIAIAWAGGKVKTSALLRNWGIVYAGNFVGSIGTAILMFLSEQYTFGANGIGINVLKTAAAKCDYGFVQALVLGILCNALVCLAVWLTFSARSTTDKILSIIFPITAFVAAGFEHSVANMYFIPIGLFIKRFDPSWVDTYATDLDLSMLTWENFFVKNLLPVTIGNIIGGAVLVALVYWFVYLRPRRA